MQDNQEDTFSLDALETISKQRSALIEPLAAIRQAEEKRDIDGSDPNWNKVHSIINESALSAPEVSAVLSLDVVSQMKPGSPSYNSAWSLFRSDVGRIEHQGQTAIAMKLMERAIRISGKPDPAGPGADDGDGKGHFSSFIEALNNAEESPLQHTAAYPVPDDWQVSNAGEYLRYIDKYSKKNPEATTASLARVLQSPATKDSPLESNLWTAFGEGIHKVSHGTAKHHGDRMAASGYIQDVLASLDPDDTVHQQMLRSFAIHNNIILYDPPKEEMTDPPSSNLALPMRGTLKNMRGL